jgi:hypothetical protein
MVEYAAATAGIRHLGAAIAEMDNSEKREARGLMSVIIMTLPAEGDSSKKQEARG